MQKIFSKKVAIVCIAVAVTFSLMSFSENENQANYGTSTTSNVTPTVASVNEDANITAALRVLVAVSRVVVNAAVEAAEFVAVHQICYVYKENKIETLASVAKIQEIKFKSLD